MIDLHPLIYLISSPASSPAASAAGMPKSAALFHLFKDVSDCANNLDCSANIRN
jgi:hypothetical protein